MAAAAEKDDDYLSQSNNSQDSAILTYEKNLSPKYHEFSAKYKTQLVWFNLASMLINAGLGYLNYWILQNHPNECAGIKLACWSIFALYVVQILFNFMCLCGLEKRWCNNIGLMGLFVFDVVVLVWSQITYFQSQETNCIDTVPILYFWLMTQILFFYVVIMLIVCYFFRRLCQDPKLVKRLEQEREEEFDDFVVIDDDERSPRLKNEEAGPK